MAIPSKTTLFLQLHASTEGSIPNLIMMTGHVWQRRDRLDIVLKGNDHGFYPAQPTESS